MNPLNFVKRKHILAAFLAATNVISGISNHQRAFYMADALLDAGRSPREAKQEGWVSPTLGAFNEYVSNSDKVFPEYPKTLGKKVYESIAGNDGNEVRGLAANAFGMTSYITGLPGGYVGGYLGAKKALREHGIK
jgi:hypothetical protein